MRKNILHNVRETLIGVRSAIKDYNILASRIIAFVFEQKFKSNHFLIIHISIFKFGNLFLVVNVNLLLNSVYWIKENYNIFFGCNSKKILIIRFHLYWNMRYRYFAMYGFKWDFKISTLNNMTHLTPTFRAETIKAVN